MEMNVKEPVVVIDSKKNWNPIDLRENDPLSGSVSISCNQSI